MKFALIFTLFGYEVPDSNYVIDYDMSGADCVQRLEQEQAKLETIFGKADFRLSCEIDDAVTEE